MCTRHKSVISYVPPTPKGLLAFPLVFNVLHCFLFGRSPLKNLYFVYSMVCYMHIDFYNTLKMNNLKYKYMSFGILIYEFWNTFFEVYI